jgi:TolA-binding protein
MVLKNMVAPTMTAATLTDDLKKPSPPPVTATAATTYVALIQQYLNLFEHANALWLAERCVAEYPDNFDAVYLQALCHYRMGKIQNARAVLERHSTSTAWSPSMSYLAGQCSYELREYNRAETILLKDTRNAYQKSKEANVTLEEWILQTTVSPEIHSASDDSITSKHSHHRS